MILSKNVNNKKCAPKLVFFYEKKLRKTQMIFDIENSFWKSNFGTLQRAGKARQSIPGCFSASSRSAKIGLSKWIFYIKNHLNLSDFFSLKNKGLGAHFLLK